MILILLIIVFFNINGAQQKQVKVSTRINYHNSVHLYKTAKKPYEEFARDFIEKNALVYITNEQVNTVIEFVNETQLKKNQPIVLNLMLQYAIRCGKYGLMTLLINAGADINYVDEYSRTHLFYAFLYPVNLEICHYLLDKMNKFQIPHQDVYRKKALDYLNACCDKPTYLNEKPCTCKKQILEKLLDIFKNKKKIIDNLKNFFYGKFKIIVN